MIEMGVWDCVNPCDGHVDPLQKGEGKRTPSSEVLVSACMDS